MDRKQMCVSNVKYRKPTQREGKRIGNLLKYLTYRESRTERARQSGGKARWLDHGDGRFGGQRLPTVAMLSSTHVLLFTLVINPNTDLIRMLPPEDREHFVKQLTTSTMNDFFDARGIDTGVEWSAVLHHRKTDGEEAPGQHNPHTHIVLPGTYYDADEGRRKPLYFSRNKSVDHIEMLHEVTQTNMTDLMDRYAGHDWEQRYDDLEAIREQQEQVAVIEEAHGLWGGDPVWAGIRRTDDDTSAAGFYGYFEDREGRLKLQFRPLMPDLDHQEAEKAAEYMKERLQEDAKTIQRDELRPSLDF
ncbi:hypothetical protein HC928_14890 [bacterium]|nr:hypothetical protein [bacterium]